MRLSKPDQELKVWNSLTEIYYFAPFHAKICISCKIQNKSSSLCTMWAAQAGALFPYAALPGGMACI